MLTSFLVFSAVAFVLGSDPPALTQEVEGSSARILVIGDWGGQGSSPFYTKPQASTALRKRTLVLRLIAPFAQKRGIGVTLRLIAPFAQVEVAKSMGEFAASSAVDAGLLLGDNFYDDGVRAVVRHDTSRVFGTNLLGRCNLPGPREGSTKLSTAFIQLRL
jgi:hypothetical protein